MMPKHLVELRFLYLVQTHRKAQYISCVTYKLKVSPWNVLHTFVKMAVSGTALARMSICVSHGSSCSGEYLKVEEF